jgi:hypothetical protein
MRKKTPQTEAISRQIIANPRLRPENWRQKALMRIWTLVEISEANVGLRLALTAK